jgi:nicotinate dehydrogenase subunit A
MSALSSIHFTGTRPLVRDIELTVNGEARRLRISETATLLEALRNHLELKAAKYGCGAGQCGTCAVIVDGEERPACQVEVGNLAGKSIETLEGIGTPDRPHPLQTAFLELQAGQCGYCLAGVLVGAKALLDRNPTPSRAETATALAWHLCRCGAHNRILEAVALAAKRMREAVA